tara:strand:- start:61740 stop:62333 length:594 start_codon:yes stop_codon:yes gene_type:complete
MLVTNKIKNIILILSLVLNLVLGYLAFHKAEPEVIKTRIRMDIPVPGKINSFPPVELPIPKTVKPRPNLIKEYIASTDKKKDSLYADAVTERFYDINYKDSIQEVNVKTNVQGKLLNQVVDYKIYPSSITLDTVITISTPKVNKAFLMMEIGQDITNINNISPVGKAGIIIKNKKDNLLSASIDTKTNLFIGIGFKL